MKKSIIYMVVLCGMLLVSTFFVGEMLQNNLYKLFSHQSGVKIELIQYQKSFFSAKMQVKVSVPIENRAPLVFFISSDIKHYPYKATKVNHITFPDPELAAKMVQFFNDKDWLNYREEIDLFGTLTGRITIAKGMFNNQLEYFQSQPLNVSYEYDLNNYAGQLHINWGGFNSKTEETSFYMKGLIVQTSFSSVDETDFINYQYHSKIESIELKEASSRLAAKVVWLQGDSEVSADKLTLNTQNNLKIADYWDGEKLFSDNQFNLSLSGLNLAELSRLKSGSQQPDEIQQALQDIFKRGAHIDLKDLRSITPWGGIVGHVNMVLQPGGNLMEVVVNPLNLIDYLDGELSLSLPKKLLSLSDIGTFLKVGVESGLLEQIDERLLLHSSLDRGELVINGNVIPM